MSDLYRPRRSRLVNMVSIPYTLLRRERVVLCLWQNSSALLMLKSYSRTLLDAIRPRISVARQLLLVDQRRLFELVSLDLVQTDSAQVISHRGN